MMTLELEFELHEAAEPFFIVRALILPKDSELRYELVDKKTTTGTDAVGFRAVLQKVRFPKGPRFEFYVIREGRRQRVTVALPPWPVSAGYTIRLIRFTGELKLT